MARRSGCRRGQSNSIAALNQALAQGLKAAGIQLSVATTASDVSSSDPKTVKSQTEGLVFYVERFLQIPNLTDTYFATVTMGSAGT